MADEFAADIELLLQEIPGDSPAGSSLRYDAVFQEIRKAREEDDPGLPMGEWERPLKKADWKAVASLASDALARRSKDLQVAGWLCEAWIHLSHAEGALAGAQLLFGLVERYWDGVHPLLDDGDIEPRIAPFVWMNEVLPLKLKLHLPLLVVPDRQPPQVSLSDWERVVNADLRRETRNEEAQADETREQLYSWAEGRNLARLVFLDDKLGEAVAAWDGLARHLDERLGTDSPSLNKIVDQLQRLQRAVRSLLQDRDPRRAAVLQQAPVEQDEEDDWRDAETQESDAMAEQEPLTAARGSAGHADVPVLPTGAIASREEAYRLLEAAATYLQRTEPHSPTPYLVRRAVSWGRMSLADLMQEIVREEGDLSRYFTLLGLNQNDR